jgi:hypothetical protein
MRRSHWYLRPLPNAAIAAVYVAFVALAFYVEGGAVIPLATAGAAVGVLSALFEVLSRRDIAQRLRDARTLGEVILAYKFSPWGKFKNLIIVAGLVGAWFGAAPRAGIRILDSTVVLFSGFAFIDAGARAALGLTLARLFTARVAVQVIV